MENIERTQMNILEYSRDFLSKQTDTFDSVCNPEFYLNSWAPTIGNTRLKILSGSLMALPSLWFFRIKDFIIRWRYTNFEILSYPKKQEYKSFS